MRVGNIYSPLEYLYKDGIHALEVAIVGDRWESLTGLYLMCETH